jgi:hypothetical protein
MKSKSNIRIGHDGQEEEFMYIYTPPLTLYLDAVQCIFCFPFLLVPLNESFTHITSMETMYEAECNLTYTKVWTNLVRFRNCSREYFLVQSVISVSHSKSGIQYVLMVVKGEVTVRM